MFCRECGKEVQEGWIRCPYCGTLIGNKKLIKKNAEESKETKKYINRQDKMNGKSQQVVNNSMSVKGNKSRIEYRRFWKYLLLSIVTCGIYGIYFLYGYVKDINRLCEGDGRESKNYIVVLLLSVITCGIYGIYWWYVQGERLYNIAPRYNVNVREKGSGILLWEILGCTIVPGIGMMVVTYIMVDNMNILAKAYNGEISENDFPRLKNPHPHLVRNVLIGYGVFLIAVIVTIFLMLSVLFIEDSTEDSQETERIIEEKISYSDVDIEGLIGQSEEILKDTDFTYNEDGIGYQLLDGNVVVDCTDGIINMIMITGDTDGTPSFHGVNLGMSIEEAEGCLADKYENAGENEGRKAYLDISSRISVGIREEADVVTEIVAVQLAEEELQGYVNEEYIFPDSDKKYLSEDEVRSITIEDMMIGRNEIFARHGYIFQDEGLKAYFESMSWYEGTVPSDQFNSEAVLNDFEKKNVELIKRVEDEINGVGQANVGQVAEPFIGMEGVYICTSVVDGDFTGKISVSGVSNDSVNLTLGCLDLSYDIATIQGQIVDSKTVQADLSGFIITLIWSDPENMIVLGQGDLLSRDAGVIEEITDNQSYTRPLEFNQW